MIVQVEPFTGTDIISFTFDEQTSDAFIDNVDHTIDIEVQPGTDITDLTPFITTSLGATINLTGPQDFSDNVIYTINAENGDTQDWTVTVTIPNSAPIIANSFPNDFGAPEGFGVTQISYADVFSDPDGDDLTITVSSSDENVVTVALAANNQISINEVGVGESMITVTADDGPGGSISDTFTFTVSEVLGLGDQLDIQVYPNPTTDFVNIESNNVLTIQLLDLNGRSIEVEKGTNIQIDLRALSSGSYILLLTDGTSTTKKRIIKAN